MERAVALVLSALSAVLTANACGGASFSEGDTPAGGTGSTSAAAAGESGAPGMAHGGQASDGGTFGGAGDTSPTSAGESSNAGAAGTSAVLGCSELGGHEFLAHCYVDVTTKSVSYAEAVASCAKLSSEALRTGQLLVLDSVEEQAFVLLQFMSDFTDASDAWLGLTCDSTQYPQFTSCYCINCDASQRAEKRAAWTWLDGSKADFGWVGQNPDGAGRCSAFAYNPSNSTWGWVDRDCTKTTHQLTGYPAHDYRTICELE
jgi:hypothetical protein